MSASGDAIRASSSAAPCRSAATRLDSRRATAPESNASCADAAAPADHATANTDRHITSFFISQSPERVSGILDF